MDRLPITATCPTCQSECLALWAVDVTGNFAMGTRIICRRCSTECDIKMGPETISSPMLTTHERDIDNGNKNKEEVSGNGQDEIRSEESEEEGGFPDW